MVKNKILVMIFFVFCAVILALSLRGIAGNPSDQNFNDEIYKDKGPFELSPERGRFALIYSLVENHSFKFSVPVARLATPDVATVGNDYVSLFAPGVSFLAIPGYLVGRTVGLSQVGAYSTSAIFAFFNIVLIMAIAIRLGTSKIAAAIASIIFIFATPAFNYAVILYQHHISSFLILLSLYILLRWKNILSLFLIWFLCAASIPVDYPNLFLMLPIGIFALGRIINIKKQNSNFEISLKLAGFITLLAALIPIIFFLWFNKMSYGNPFQLAGTLKSVTEIDENGQPIPADKLTQITGLKHNERDPNNKKTAVGFFKSRNIMDGLYVHLMSPDRGVLVYTPVIIFAIFGMINAYRKKDKFFPLFISIIAVDLLLYSMWGDPYGGWAFGSRYLIPSYAIGAIFIAQGLSKLRNLALILIFAVAAIYSIAVNTLGAVTSSRNPPKVEAVALQNVSHITEYYTYQRNFDYLVSQNRSKSFIYENYLYRYIPSWQYYLLVAIPIVGMFMGMLVYLRLKEASNVRI